MTADSLTGNLLPIMKRLQPQRVVEKLWSQAPYAFLASLQKVGGFTGSQMDVPLEHDHSARSRVFANALTNSFGVSATKYSLTRAKDYSVGIIDAETMHAMSDDKGAWYRALQRRMANTHSTLKKSTALSIYRNHGGAMGKIASVIDGDGTNDVLVLESKSDVYNFSKGASLDFSTTDGTSGAVLAKSGNIYVSKLDFDLGHVYISTTQGSATPANYATILTGEAETEYVFIEGDFGNSFRGLDSWVPLVAPTSGDSFLGIDRSVDVNRLAGHRYNNTSASYDEIIQELAMRISYTGGGDLVCFMSPVQLKQFALQMEVKVTRDPGGKGRAGFSGICIDTAKGSIEVISDPACPQDRLYLLDLSTWRFHHMLGLPHLVEDDGLGRLRSATADEIQFRYRLWGNMACYKPGANAVAVLPNIL